MAADPLTTATVDDLFNTDFSDLDDDPFNDKPAQNTRDDKAVLSPRAGLKRKAGNDDYENNGLGLDEEVKIIKRRQPIAKLDEERLLSEPGIPKLRAVSRSGRLSKKLRFKGKGHEFSDAARLLNHFQLWLDNLYPRAKFADALQMVEKAGHTKRMQLTRNEWINEGKPWYRKYGDGPQEGAREKEPDLFQPIEEPSSTALSNAPGETAVQTDSIFGNGLDEDTLFIPDANRPSRLEPDGLPDDDELDALLAENGDLDHARESARQQQRDESEGEDDLDALLAEQDTQRNTSSAMYKPSSSSKHAADEEDHLDALLSEQNARDLTATNKADEPSLMPSNVPVQDDVPEDDDEDDLEALIAMQRSRSKPATRDSEPSLPTPQPTSSPIKATTNTPRANSAEDVNNLTTTIFSSSPVPNNPEDVDLEDLDALLASQEEKIKQREQQRETSSTPRASRFREMTDVLLSSSPVPNSDSQ